MQSICRVPYARSTESLPSVCHRGPANTEAKKGGAERYRVNLGMTIKKTCLAINKKLSAINKKTFLAIKQNFPQSHSAACIFCSFGCSLNTPGPVVLWSLGPLVLWSLGPLVTLVPWSSTFLVLAPLVPWCLVLVSWSLGPGPGALDPLVPRSFGYLWPLLCWSWSLHPCISGPLVPWSLGPLVSWSFGLLSSSLFGFCSFLLGLCSFCGFGFSHPLLSQLDFGRGFLHPPLAPLSIEMPPLFESSLFRSSGGANPPLLCRFFAPH